MDTAKSHITQSAQEQISRLQEIVQDSINEQKLVVDNLLNEPEEILTRGQSISDKVARFGGSWNFIISFSIILLVWIVFNSYAANKFDPYPFILMNLVLSTIAALQAPVIMMSQNRKEERDRKRNENDYMVNLKAELQVRSLHQKIDLMQKEQMKVLYETQAKQLELLEKIEKSLQKTQ
ncbi:MAG: cyclic nucleotide-binding protein [Bacteroidetes bacterium]|nr:MAG: cyclic nucleotide-binding protein [Bacteroidota bacterium]